MLLLYHCKKVLPLAQPKSFLQTPSSLSSKRPSFTWIQYQSPKKGFLTIVAVVGSFLGSWLPWGTVTALEVFGRDSQVPLWTRELAFLSLVASFASHPVVYGLMNRAIRSEIRPAIWPPKNKALRGLPRKHSLRRISMPSMKDRFETFSLQEFY